MALKEDQSGLFFQFSECTYPDRHDDADRKNDEEDEQAVHEISKKYTGCVVIRSELQTNAVPVLDGHLYRDAVDANTKITPVFNIVFFSTEKIKHGVQQAHFFQ